MAEGPLTESEDRGAPAAAQDGPSPEKPDSKPLSPSGNSRNPWLTVLLAWVVPGGGHMFLGRVPRAIAFFCVLGGFVALGFTLEGKVAVPERGKPLTVLSSLGCAGLGPGYLGLVAGSRVSGSLRSLRAGNPRSVTFEHGSVFLLSAGIMNLLLILDAWDIAMGRKS